METETDVYGDRRRKDRGMQQVLYVAFRGHAPRMLPSRHVVDDIDVVELGRGSDGVVRDRRAGARRLVVRVDDPLTSTEHCTLTHAVGDWVIDDRRSKNGTFVEGARVDQSALAHGQVVSLGHTLVVLAREPAGDGALDLGGSDLPLRGGFATFHAAFGEALDRMAKVARDPRIAILVNGETGTGKELVARAVHRLGRRSGNFVPINCGAIPTSLIEDELFGHRRGAFSGASDERLGHFRTADRGTVFFDEIAELPLDAQARLLRVLQERDVVPVGESLPEPVDVQIVAATHRDLAKRVAEGAFRHDLWERIRAAVVVLPALRERRADLGLLIAALLERHAPGQGLRITPQAATVLFQYAWPGNVRELENVMLVMLANADGAPLALDHMPLDMRDRSPSLAAKRPTRSRPPLTPPQLEEKREVEAMLREDGATIAEVARRLGKDRKQIYRMIDQLGIDLARLRDS